MALAYSALCFRCSASRLNPHVTNDDQLRKDKKCGTERLSKDASALRSVQCDVGVWQVGVGIGTHDGVLLLG